MSYHRWNWEPTAPNCIYDLVHAEFLKHLGPKTLAWQDDCVTRMVWEHQRIPKIWRQATITALAKPGRYPHLAASYPPISLYWEYDTSCLNASSLHPVEKFPVFYRSTMHPVHGIGCLPFHRFFQKTSEGWSRHL